MNRDHFLLWTNDVWNYLRYIDIRLRSFDDADADYDLLDREPHVSGLRITKRNGKEFFGGLEAYLDVTRRRERYRHAITVVDNLDRSAFYYIEGVQLSHGKKLVDDKSINEALAEMCAELDPTDMVYFELQRKSDRKLGRRV